MRRLILSFALVLVCGVALAQDVEGELPAKANAKSVKVDTRCTIVVGGKNVDCYYDPENFTWTPEGITNNPAVANCLDAAAAGIYNADMIAEQFNTLLADYNQNKKDTESAIEALQEGLNALWDALADLDEDGEVEINECNLCNHKTKYNSITIDDDDGRYTIDETSSRGCAETAKKMADSIVNMGQAIAADRARITDAETRLTDAETTLENHEGRISALENENNKYAKQASVDALYLWGANEHKRLLRKIGSVSEDLYAHINNGDGDGDGGGTNIIEFATCDLCSNTNGISMASLSFQPRKEGSLGKPEVPAQIVNKTKTVDGCEGAVSQLESNINALISAVEYVLPVPPKLDEHIDWAKEDSAAQWDAINDSSLRKTTYTGSVNSLAEALDPTEEGQIGGQVMILAAGSTTNYYAIDIGKLDFPECDGLSSNDVDTLIKHYIDSEGGGCACTPDEYLKEETDPVWEEEKAGYVTKDEFENTREALMAAMDQLHLEIEHLEGNIAIVQNMAESAISATKTLDERITALESLTNNATGGN